MDEKKNNSLEKAENIMKSKEKTHSEKNQPQYKSAKQRIKAKAKADRLKKKAEKKEEKERIKVEKQRIQAEKRIEKARIKNHRRAEKEKAKATALREKNRHKAMLKQRKAQIKADKIKRREMLKHESRKEREERIKAEKQAKHDKKVKLRQLREKRRADKLKDRQLKREKDRAERQKNKDRRKGTGGYVTAVISLSIATLVLASVLTVTYLMPTENDNSLEAGYQKSFYDTVEQVDNIDLNLSKILTTKDSGAIQKYLVDTAINSELCENDLQQLPVRDESKFYTTKLINQIGDYSKYLNKKLIDGEKLTEKDRENLKELYKGNLELKKALNKIIEGMGDDYSFTKMLEEVDGVFLTNFNNLQNLSVKYPELIYDGPFSDGQDNREIKGLSGKDVTESQGKEIFQSIFAPMGIKDVECDGQCSGDIKCYNFTGKCDDNTIYGQISVKGGKLIMFDMLSECKENNTDRETAIDIGKKFITENGIKDAEPVWINFSNNVFTINYAVKCENVILYPDLIKIKVCNGKVMGFEGKSYYTNHTERKIENPKITVEQARENIIEGMDIISSRLAVVPVGLRSEKLCYEFFGEIDGSQYYIYMSAINGSQVEMFKVIKSTEGSLLM